MAKLTRSEIAGFAAQAGFSGEALDIAVAIALAESGGDPDVLGDLSLGISVGLWQINLHWHPEYTQAMLLNPQTNANAAFKIYIDAHRRFTPWSTFKTFAYRSHLPPTIPTEALPSPPDEPA